MCGPLGRVGVPWGGGLPSLGLYGLSSVGAGEGVSGGWVSGGRVLFFGRVGEARVAGPGGARDGGCVWVSGWAARGKGHRRGLRGLEEKRAVFCGRGKDFADELAYLVHLLASGEKRVC